jgi:hypothetical protein
MAKRTNPRLKLPDDFLGTVQAFLNTAPPPKKKAVKKVRKPKAAKR